MSRQIKVIKDFRIFNQGMGTKIECSINILATLADSNKLAVGGVDVWEHYYQNKGRLSNNRHRTGINKLQDPMDHRMLDRNNIEFIKKTMLMHEDIFKHQVRELHRVYNMQKMLMEELKHQSRQQKLQRGFDLEKPAEEDIFIQSCKTSTCGGGGGSNEEMDVDLTLSIGVSQLKNSHMPQFACLHSPNGKSLELNSCASLKSDRIGECSDSATPMSFSRSTA